MIIALRRIGSSAASAAFAGFFTWAAPATAAENVAAIATAGTGTLTMCPYRGCNKYHHIVVPERIAVGDEIAVHFGSNPKHYDFPVARIVRDGDACTVFSQANDTHGVEKIELASCSVTPGAQ